MVHLLIVGLSGKKSYIPLHEDSILIPRGFTFIAFIYSIVFAVSSCYIFLTTL